MLFILIYLIYFFLSFVMCTHEFTSCRRMPGQEQRSAAGVGRCAPSRGSQHEKGAQTLRSRGRYYRRPAHGKPPIYCGRLWIILGGRAGDHNHDPPAGLNRHGRWRGKSKPGTGAERGSELGQVGQGTGRYVCMYICLEVCTFMSEGLGLEMLQAESVRRGT